MNVDGRFEHPADQTVGSNILLKAIVQLIGKYIADPRSTGPGEKPSVWFRRQFEGVEKAALALLH